MDKEKVKVPKFAKNQFWYIDTGTSVENCFLREKNLQSNTARVTLTRLRENCLNLFLNNK